MCGLRVYSVGSYSDVEKLQSRQRKQGRGNTINLLIEGMLALKSLVLPMGLDSPPLPFF